MYHVSHTHSGSQGSKEVDPAVSSEVFLTLCQDEIKFEMAAIDSRFSVFHATATATRGSGP